jgi:hypothetical protein
MCHRLLALAALGLCATLTAAPISPPDPDVWNVQVRYHVFAYGDLRLRQYTEMMNALKAAGFQRDTEEEVAEDEAADPTRTRLRGTISDKNLPRLLQQRHVRSVLLIPKDSKLPEKAARVRVDLQLLPGLTLVRQRQLARQVAAVLAKRGFQEAVMYDDRGGTRLLGSFPADGVEVLLNDWRLFNPTLLSGLRETQGGTEVVVRLLQSWYGTREGKKLIDPILTAWRKQGPAIILINEAKREMPDVEVAVQESIIQNRLLVQLGENPGSADLLDRLQAELLRSPAYAPLINRLLLQLPGGAVLPSPFRDSSMLRAIRVYPNLPVPAPMPATPKIPAGQEKFTPDLRALFAAGDGAAKPTRMEVILGYTPAPNDRQWEKIFDVPGVLIEGRLGSLVTILASPKETAPALAAREEVVNLRLPRTARKAASGPRGSVPEKWEPIRASGLARLHALGFRGQGTRIALVADDFHGWEKLKNRKEGKLLLPDPVLVDLTAERRRDLLPEPFPSTGKDVALGHGTRLAATILKAAPEAELTLIRIDADAPYMVQTVARAINGEAIRTVALDTRLREIEDDQVAHESRRDALEEERRIALDNFRDDPEVIKRKKEYLARQAAFDKEEKDIRDRQRRYVEFTRTLATLKGIRVVASGLVWTEGYPVDGSSALSRYFDDRPFRAALWFQAAGDTGGQAWTGLFRDEDANGVMEFAEAKPPLPAGAWTTELSYLSWQPGGKAQRDLPAGTHVRLTLQWREPHDPLPLRQGDDVYRDPLAKLKLVLVHQPDPDGKTRPSDDLEVIAQTVGAPQRLDQTLHAATYEAVIDLRIPKAGRYAVYIEGRPPESLHAAGEAFLPAMAKASELRLRLFVNTLEGAGRAVWSDYTTRAAALGMPADAGRVIAVGAADSADGVRPSSASGPAFNLALLPKPNVFAYDEGGGTAEAASFAAGLAASSWGSRGTLFGVLEALRVRPGSVLRIPAPGK